jgi:hypothetical protein
MTDLTSTSQESIGREGESQKAEPAAVVTFVILMIFGQILKWPILYRESSPNCYTGQLEV